MTARLDVDARKPKYINLGSNVNKIYCSVINPKTGIIEQHFKANSFVDAYIKHHGAIVGSASSYFLPLITTGSQSIVSASSRLSQGGGDANGILVSSDDTGVAITDAVFAGRWTSSEVSYGTRTITPVQVSLTESYIDIERTITALQDNVEIKSIALAGRNSTVGWMLARDVLPAPITLNNTDARVFRYRIYLEEFLKNWNIRMCGGFLGADQDAVNTLGGTISTRSTFADEMSASSGDAAQGIIIGSGLTAVDYEDYNLDIPHTTTDFTFGSSTGTLATDVVANIGWAQVQRTFTNISGSDKTISEVGLIYKNPAGGERFFLVHRHVLATPVVVADAEPFVVTYRFIIES
jgi:hypothetical protein